MNTIGIFTTFHPAHQRVNRRTFLSLDAWTLVLFDLSAAIDTVDNRLLLDQLHRRDIQCTPLDTVGPYQPTQ